MGVKFTVGLDQCRNWNKGLAKNKIGSYRCMDPGAGKMQERGPKAISIQPTHWQASLPTEGTKFHQFIYKN